MNDIHRPEPVPISDQMIIAAQAADHPGEPGWRPVPATQLARLLAGAAPLIAAAP